MSLVEDEKIDDLGQEVEVKVEEVFINLDYVKQELDEEVLDFEEGDKVNQNEIPLKIEKVFSTNSLKEEVDSLPNDIIVEETVIKSEEIIEETDSRTDDNNFYCELCERPYEGYCSNCSILYIINNIVPHLNSESNLKTIPTDILQIRDILRRKGVFALRTIPKGVTFGPFEGISAVENTNGHVWKIKDYKFANDENANWMKYVICGTSQLSVNLDIFQFDANLYFQTNREINYGEELLLHFGEAVMLKLNNEEEYFLAPEEKEEFPKVFACTFCCLGFRLKRYLMGHKTKCPYQKHNMNIEEFEVIECCYCKMWLEKQEYLTHHMVYCLDNYNSDADRAINILLEKGCKCVIITLGSKGAAFATSDKRNPVHVSTPPIQPVDTTGAGDAFIGALAFLLVQHKDLQLKEVIKAACYIATESCKKPGTQISFPIGQVLSEYLEYNQF